VVGKTVNEVTAGHEEPVELPTGNNPAALAAHWINLQRLAASACFNGDKLAVHAQRRSSVERLGSIAADIVKMLRPDAILEIGAHEGTFSLRVKAALPDSRVVAFEGNPEVYAKYAECLSRAGVEVHNLLVSNSAGTSRMNVPVTRQTVRSGMGSMLFDSRAEHHVEYDVPTVTIDDFLGSAVCTTALWIDVEGAVGQVLEGAKQSLQSCIAIFVELETAIRWPGQALAHEVIPILTDAGFVPLLADNQREWQFNVMFVRPQTLNDKGVIRACYTYFGNT
jgi:FkbM family methyltransferase